MHTSLTIFCLPVLRHTLALLRHTLSCMMVSHSQLLILKDRFVVQAEGSGPCIKRLHNAGQEARHQGYGSNFVHVSCFHCQDVAAQSGMG